MTTPASLVRKPRRTSTASSSRRTRACLKRFIRDMRHACDLAEAAEKRNPRFGARHVLGALADSFSDLHALRLAVGEQEATAAK